MKWVKSSHCDTNACVEVAWTKAMHCDNGASCVEVAWIKSPHCDTGTCVEIGHTGDKVLMRDSKDPDGPVLQFSKERWHEFIEFLKN